MVQRVLFYGLFLVAAGVLPYLSSEWSNASRSAANGDASTAGETSTASGVAVTSSTLSAVLPAVTTAPQPARPQPGELPVIDLVEAIRFDVTPSWLFQRWPRVVTGLPEGELQGYRVPLITGTREDDIAGSLTYYFNARQACQKITLQGSVGDPRKLSAHVVGRFGLLRQTSGDAGLHLYQTRWNGKPVSELKIKAVPVVKASAPHARYDIEMVLNSWPHK
ncbi:MAG: DUF6690 family protein [Pirellulales bacterium]